jgi:hypothetical protein
MFSLKGVAGLNRLHFLINVDADWTDEAVVAELPQPEPNFFLCPLYVGGRKVEGCEAARKHISIGPPAMENPR